MSADVSGAAAGEESHPPAPVLRVPAATELDRNLTLSIGDGAAYGVMVGLGETYLSAFALAVGLGEVYTGLLASLPILFGSLIQVISPFGVRCFQSHRRWVVCCAGLQAACFLPLIYAAWRGHIDHVPLMIIASIYWAASLGTGPAWNTWMGNIVPVALRPTFFARRSRLNQAMVFVGFLGGGLILQAGKQLGARETQLMFVALFAISFLCRTISTTCLYFQGETPPDRKSLRDLSSKVIRSRLFTGMSGRLLGFAVMMQAGVYFCGPYFSPYMLKTLGMEYWEYAVLLSVSFVTKFLCLPFWGRYAHRVGAQRLLWIGAIGIVPLSGGWLISSNFLYLMALQLAGGATWGAYELALFLLFFETIPARERTAILTWYNVANSAALAFGSMLGGLTLNALGVTPEAYLTVFVGSSMLRGCSVFMLLGMPRTQVEASPMPMRPLSVQPSAGSLDSPILPAMPDQQQKVVGQRLDEGVSIARSTSMTSSSPPAPLPPGERGEKAKSPTALPVREESLPRVKSA